MGKFCTRCGRPLQEGEICICRRPQETPVQEAAVPAQETAAQSAATVQTEAVQQEAGNAQEVPTVQPQASQGNQTAAGNPAATGFFKKLLDTFVGLIIHPVATGRQMIIEANLGIAAIFIALQAVMSGLFAVAICAKGSSYLQYIARAVESYSSLFSNGLSLGSMLKLPLGRVFFVTFFASAVLSCLLAAMLLAGHMIIKCKVKYQEMLAAVAVRSALIAPGILAAIILSALNTVIGIFLFFALSIWGFTVMKISMTACLNEKILNAFAIMLSIVLFVFVMLTVFAMAKMWTLFLPDVLRTAISAAKSMVSDPSQLMYSIFQNMF